MNRVKSLVVTYVSTIVATWIGYLLGWVTLVGAFGISLILLGLLGVTSWLSSWLDN